MKTLLLMANICAFIAAHAQTAKPGFEGYVKFEGTSGMGTITVLSTGVGQTRAQSAADAATRAFYILLFRGIAGSQYDLPMIPDEDVKKNDRTIKELLRQEYATFITENILQMEYNRTKKKDGAKGKMTVHKITINYDALRRHLENKGVIRNFGL